MPSSLWSFKVVDCPDPISLPTLSLCNLVFLSSLKLEPQDPLITSLLSYCSWQGFSWDGSAAQRTGNKNHRSETGKYRCVFSLWYSGYRLNFECPSQLDRNNSETWYGLLGSVLFQYINPLLTGRSRLNSWHDYWKVSHFYQSQEGSQILSSTMRTGSCFPGDGDV